MLEQVEDGQQVPEQGQGAVLDKSKRQASKNLSRIVTASGMAGGKPLDRYSVFGKVCSLMSTIPFYQVLPLVTIERRVASALARNQFIYFEDRKGKPAGFASWIVLTEDEEEAYLSDPVTLTQLEREKLSSAEVPKSGNLWIVDFCGSPKAARKIAKHLKARLERELPDYKKSKAVRWHNRRPFPFLMRYEKPGADQAARPEQKTPITREARLHDVYDLAPRMRWQDVEELRLSSGRNPYAALLNAHSKSKISRAFEFGDRCIGMYGIADSHSEDEAGVIWLLSNEELQDFALYKARIGKEFVRESLLLYPKLMNYIHEQTQSDTIEWLKFLGFRFTDRYSNFNGRGGVFWRFEYTK